MTRRPNFKNSYVIPLSDSGSDFKRALLSPLIVLRWLGIDQIPQLQALGQNKLVSLAGAVTGFLTLSATVITILTGWDTASTVAARILGTISHK